MQSLYHKKIASLLAVAKKNIQPTKTNCMQWYIAKLVYQIVNDKNLQSAQFDEQLRLIEAEDEFIAAHKATLLGARHEDKFLNVLNKVVHWKFIDVAEICKVNELCDGAEMYSRICVEKDSDIFIATTKLTASYLLRYTISISLTIQGN